MLTPWKENYDNLDSILKSRDITVSIKVHLVKAMVFPVVMYGCESWTVKKIKAVYCHPAFLTCMQSTSCEMPDWMKHKLESRLGEKYQ